MPESTFTTYSWFYKACKTFSDDYWTSIFAALALVVAGTLAQSEVQLKVLA